MCSRARRGAPAQHCKPTFLNLNLNPKSWGICRGAAPSAAAKEACYALVMQLLDGAPALLTPPVQAPADARAPAAARVSFGVAQGPLHTCQPLPEDRWPTLRFYVNF